MSLQLFKEKIFVKTVVYLSLFFGAYGFTALADTLCKCKEIIETKKCDNPDCIKICALLDPLASIDSHLAEICLGKGNQTFTFKKENVKATKIEALSKKAKARIMKIQARGKSLLEKNCPHCQLIPKVSARFKVEPQKENCPARYLKTHHYKKSKTIDLQRGNCNKTKILRYFENYVRDLVTGKSDVSKKLWKACPNPCSFEVNYTAEIDEEQCKGDVDVKVDCTHRVDKSFLGIPIYDVEISYTGDLKCEESSHA